MGIPFARSLVYPAANIDPSNIFIGIEGGSSHSTLVVIDNTGKKYGKWTHGGLNCCLKGHVETAQEIAEWLKVVKNELGIVAPIGAVGMGLAGAEDEAINEEIINYLCSEHGDIAQLYSITTDSVVTIAATFSHGGVVLIAGTGSSCRLLKADFTVQGAGGWGHLIGDGGSAFWIAKTAIQMVFDDDDGLYAAPYSTKTLKELLLKHFKIDDKIEMLDFLYTNFEKSQIASFAETIALEGADDPLVQEIFRQAGEVLGRHVRAVSKYFDDTMLRNVPLVAVGSVWKSWNLLKRGFIEGVRDADGKLKIISLHQLRETPAVGAAIMAAVKAGIQVPLVQQAVIFDVIDLGRLGESGRVTIFDTATGTIDSIPSDDRRNDDEW